MKKIELTPVPHNVKIGDQCGQITPNITEDCIFTYEGQAVGFYLRSLTDKGQQLANIANHELRSKNVPKTMMDRKRPDGLDENGKKKYLVVSQYSTIIGSVPPKPHMRRPYPTISSVHGVKSAQTFIKAMLMLCKESEGIIRDIMPEQYEAQKKLLERTDKKWRFGDLFTSSISNYNIPAPFHRDAANIIGAVNVIITKRENSIGGNLNIPDYGATIDQCDNSILVYPAWRNMHGVTPIEPTKEGGYRNSLVFYPLKSFENVPPSSF
jgi:hypothetical protein